MPTNFGDRYRVARSIARGGMAEVFLATDTRLDRSIAIKVMHEELSSNTAFLSRFEREARAMAGLNHPNMVQVYDYGVESGAPYIIMEFVKGKTLRDLLRDQGIPQPQRAAEVVADVAGALQFAHDHGVVHRDVKPANIMVDTEGIVKVTDFGIAQAGDDEAHLTQVGTVVGTAAYFSPEQAQGNIADARSDVYSMGTVLYELICGKPPFEGETSWAIAYKHVNEAPTLPSQIRPGIPHPLEAVAMRAMAKDPAMRYQSAGDMQADLLRFRRGEVPLATAALTRVGAAGLAGAAVAAAGLTAVSTPVGGATAVGPNATKTGMPAVTSGRRPPSGQRPMPNKRKRWPAVLGTIAALIAVGFGLFFLVKTLAGGGGTTVPDVSGLSVENATTTLQQAGFQVTRDNQVSQDVAKDSVISTDPAAGERAPEHSTIKLVVSAGPNAIKVPNVVGKSRSAAEAILKDAGLKPIADLQESDKPVNNVIGQDPDAGTEVAEGGTVTITISSGTKQTTVPDVTGLSQDDATQSLDNAGFGNSVKKVDSDKDAGTVISQSPGALEKANRGATVTLTVSSGPKQVNIPNVTGQSASQASSTLAAAGFKVSSRNVPAVGGCTANTVCSQQPASGTASKGSTVTILVGVSSTTTTTTTTTTAP